MHWDDDGILLATRRFGERHSIAHFFTPGRGHVAALLPFATRKRGNLQAGSIAHITWHGRLQEQLGQWRSVEAINPSHYQCWQQPLALAALQSLCTLLHHTLPEQQPYTNLFHATRLMLSQLSTAPKAELLAQLAQWEMTLLTSLGYGMALEHCAITGSREQLAYISPRTGCAASKSAGLPYHNKLLPLPDALRVEYSASNATIDDSLQALNITGYFLEKWLFAPYRKPLPQPRQLLALSMANPPAMAG